MAVCGVPLHLRRLDVVVTAAPGTGSTALTTHLETITETEPLPPSDVVVDGRVIVDAKHATIAQLIAANIVTADDVTSRRIVTTTRNPFDFWSAEWHRTRTRWLAQLRDPASWVHTQAGMIDRIVDAVEQDFNTWLMHAIGHLDDVGRTMHLNPGHVAEADLVIRMEQMNDDLGDLLGVEVDVPRVNVTRDERPYWQLYSAASRRMVERVHAPDLELFGYRF